MSLIDLINHVGQENILLQPLNDCITQAHARKKTRDTLVTFATNQFEMGGLLGEKTSKIGLILWIPKDKLPQKEHNGSNQ